MKYSQSNLDTRQVLNLLLVRMQAALPFSFIDHAQHRRAATDMHKHTHTQIHSGERDLRDPARCATHAGCALCVPQTEAPTNAPAARPPRVAAAALPLVLAGEEAGVAGGARSVRHE
jgi:hypothetical protein